MRQLGWLHAIPKGRKETRWDAYKKADDDHYMLELPDVSEEYACAYLIHHLQELGLMSHSGMGPIPISWPEINAWVNATGVNLTAWELVMLKRLSHEYVMERIEASEDPQRQAPYTPASGPMTTEKRVEVENKLLSWISKRKETQKE